MAFSRSGLTHVARKFVLVAPSDTVTIMPGAVGIYVGGAGNITVTDIDNVTTLFTGVLAGTFLPISPKLIKATATSATLMVALY